MKGATPCRNLTARPATSAWRNHGAGTVARIAAAIPRRARAEPVFGTDLSPAAIIVFLPLYGKSRSPKSSSLIAHPGIGTVQRGGRSLGAPCFHVAQRRMWL